MSEKPPFSNLIKILIVVVIYCLTSVISILFSALFEVAITEISMMIGIDFYYIILSILIISLTFMVAFLMLGESNAAIIAGIFIGIALGILINVYLLYPLIH